MAESAGIVYGCVFGVTAIVAAGVSASSMYDSHCRYKCDERKERINSEERITKVKIESDSQERFAKDNAELYKLKEENILKTRMQENYLAYFREKDEKDRQFILELQKTNAAAAFINNIVDKYFTTDRSSDSFGGIAPQSA